MTSFWTEDINNSIEDKSGLPFFTGSETISFWIFLLLMLSPHEYLCFKLLFTQDAKYS